MYGAGFTAGSMKGNEPGVGREGQGTRLILPS